MELVWEGEVKVIAREAYLLLFMPVELPIKSDQPLWRLPE